MKTNTTKIKLALFASGGGSNVYNIITHFQNNPSVEVSIVLSNKADAGALIHADNAGIKNIFFSKEDFFESNAVLDFLKEQEVDYIILAGFLWKIPANILSNYQHKILNVHPSLLPKFGGKGMYGQHVHNAVLTEKETKTGITIHIVNEKYDDGAIVAQFECLIDSNETLATLQKKISNLEKENFPKTIENFIKK